MTDILPPGFTAATFTRAMQEIAAIVGPEWVFVSEAAASQYRDAYSPKRDEPGEIIPSGAIGPASVEQVQAIVKVANTYRLPLYPISTGRNLGYGGSAPVLSGSVVLDLKRMNRIIEVNEEHSFAIVEPGVTYFDLYRFLRDNNLRLWVDSPAPGWGSPLGNALDRGTGGLRFEHFDHWNQHRGLEVVLPDGELIRTGMGAMPTARTWAMHKWGIGPVVDGLFSQSNFGIVTKMGLHLTREPEAYQTATVRLKHFADVNPALRILHRLTDQDVIRTVSRLGCPSLAPVYFHADYPQDGPYWQLMDQPQQPGAEQWDAFFATTGLPAWELILSYAGNAAVVAAQWQATQQAFSVIPDASFDAGPPIRFPLSEQAAKAIPFKPWEPTLLPMSSGTRAQAGWPTQSIGHLWFSPVLPIEGEAITTARYRFAQVIRKHKVRQIEPDLPMFFDDFCIMIYGFRLSEDHDSNDRIRACYAECVKLGAELGFGEYRAHAMFQDAVIDTFSFNNHALRRFQEKLKDAVDPNGIISAGRYGIWPKYLRT